MSKLCPPLFLLSKSSCLASARISNLFFLPIMQGWRHTIAGGALMALLEGRASVSLDPASGAVRVTKRRAGES